MKSEVLKTPKLANRRSFAGGSDARIVMGNDEQALSAFGEKKRGEIEPEDLSGNLIVQLGVVTEALNRHWYEANTGHVITDVQRHVRHAAIPWMGATAACRAVMLCSKQNLFWPGISRREPRPKNTKNICRSSSTTWLLLPPGPPCFPSSRET